MTEAEKLVEECARELWYLYTTSPAWEAAEERHQETWRRYARAAISVTLEHVARVAEGATFPEPQATEPTMRVLEQGIIQGGKTTAKNIAAAIRALAPEENRKV